MIKNKENIIRLLSMKKSFKYFKENEEVDVEWKEENTINIRCYAQGQIKLNFFDYAKGVSMLYKDRKYINRELF